ncbi:AAA family ATPase [Natronomonas sp. F2-12]|jgi:cytidylate kinase|uniref:Cytidylate kinase n=1 Tax=Natronomonas aquatica TaxID=2841590 RepID=A0A9R1CT21_9EURY|nr:AAA family ATPase [Natronomonas aquatica]MCQ4333482.1 AAA family ATPase [Natronomonas aquatica]
MSDDGRDAERIDTDLFLTVSGPPGCGVTTLCEALSERLDCGYVSGGEVFREIAEERGMSLSQLTAEASSDAELDRELDRRLRGIAEKWGEAEKAFLLESRLAGYLAAGHADLRIWLDAPEEVRVERTADREEVSAEMRVREVIEEKRYAAYYGVDLSNRSFYDLAINTARWSPAGTLELVMSAIKNYDPEANEGAFDTPELNL